MDKHSKAAHGKQTNTFFISHTDNPKKFYSYIKQKKSGQSNIPVLKRNTETLGEPKDKAGLVHGYASENRKSY